MQGVENEYDEENDLCDAIVAGEAEGLDLCEVEAVDVPVVEAVAQEETQVGQNKKKRRRVVVSSDEDTESELEDDEEVLS